MSLASKVLKIFFVSLLSSLSIEHIESIPKTKLEQKNIEPNKKSFFPIPITLPALSEESNLLGFL